MSIYKTIAALEELEQEVAAEIAPSTPDVVETVEQAEEIIETSEAIDQDTQALADGADALESIIELVKGAPGSMDQPLDPFAKRAVQVALEANDVLVQSGAGSLVAQGDAKKVEEQSKKAFIDKAKDFAKKIWEALANMATRVLDWIKGLWARATDRLLKNTNRAKKLIEVAKKTTEKSGATITDERILKAVANKDGAPVRQILSYVFEHARVQSEKVNMEALRQASLLVEAVSSGKSDSAALVDRFTDLLIKNAGAWEGKASPAQAQATKSPAGTDIYVSPPFFGGMMAWYCVPENSEKLELWNHGLQKLDEPKEISNSAPSPRDIAEICDYIAKGQDLIRMYQVGTKPLDTLTANLKKAVKQEKGEGDKKLVRQLQAIIPRMVKGPQVLAYSYAATASTIALSYVEAALNVHSGKGGKSEDKNEGASKSTDLVVAG